MPQQIIQFLHEFFAHGSTVETSTLSPFERDRLSIDEFNTFYDMSQYMKDFLRLYFIIGKGLILFTLLADDSFGMKLDSTSLKNLKVISGVIYHAMMDHLLILVPSKNEFNVEEVIYEPISKLVCSRDELAYLTEKNPKFYNIE